MRFLWLALVGASCAARGEAGAPPPAAWRLVDVDVPGGRLLVLERDDPVVVESIHPVEVRLSRERAPASEVVEAEIRIRGVDGPHHVRIVPGRPGVTILGPSELQVEGARSVKVRFTCATPGRGGIRVIVRE